MTKQSKRGKGRLPGVAIKIFCMYNSNGIPSNRSIGTTQVILYDQLSDVSSARIFKKLLTRRKI